MMSTRDQLYPYANGEAFQNQTTKAVFEDIYKQSSWNINTQESVSGEGSNLEQTATLRRELPEILNQLKVKSILDIPCGDFYWMSKVSLDHVAYTGADIVTELVKQNQTTYGKEGRQFIEKNLLEDLLPKVDLIFCRDCLVHFSIADVYKAIANIKKSGAQYLMSTHFTQEDENKDIVTGGWRPLNFCLHPFNFPKPLALLNENCSEMEGAFQDKCMAVWRVAEL
ncbi:class I SAM-dependent methyltransferase [Porifericola rhodea]|uniref:class I SAM-dependent methyltransferase n=1 Tax=Porifericola rhodea TaxID=930972 RepID=UPI0026651AB8|nr:class I SAM-dependent methyltransferase [Porifericola rhodea]WKN33530.1 class I SAM-dependent methyltransferase [Porifericola rhodea]